MAATWRLKTPWRAPCTLGITGEVVTLIQVFGEAVRSWKQLGLTSSVERLPAPFAKHAECPGPLSPRDKGVPRRCGVGEPENILPRRLEFAE